MEGKREERRTVKQGKQMKERNVRQNEKELIAVKNIRRGGKNRNFWKAAESGSQKLLYFYFLYQKYFFLQKF